MSHQLISNSSLESNIVKLTIIKASKWLMLFMPIIWLFYAENGLSISDLFIIQGIYSLVIAIIEIPSGYLADVMGRKKSIVLGTLFGLLGMIAYSLSYGFSGFLLAALCLGIGQSFISGSDTALMYDSLVKLKRQNEFIKLEGRIVSAGNIAEASAFVIGGLLAEISLRTPFYAQVFIALIGFLTALLLVEPKMEEGQHGKKNAWSNIKSIIQFAIIKNKTLRHYLLYSAIIGAATLSIAWFSQPLYVSIGIESAFYFGVIGAILNLIVAVVSFYAYKIEIRFKTSNILLAILMLIMGCYFLLGFYDSQWVLIFLGVFYIARGVATPVLRDYMNRHTPSNMRATVMSLRSFVTRIIFSVISPGFGVVADLYSIQQALMLGSMIFLVLSMTSFIYLFRHERSC